MLTAGDTKRTRNSLTPQKQFGSAAIFLGAAISSGCAVPDSIAWVDTDGNAIWLCVY